MSVEPSSGDSASQHFEDYSVKFFRAQIVIFACRVEFLGPSFLTKIVAF